MAEVIFRLRKPNGDTETPISLVYRTNGIKFVYPTQLSVHPKEWNKKKMRFREQAGIIGYIKKNHRLDSLGKWTKKAHLDILANNKPVSKDELKRRVKELDNANLGLSDNLAEFMEIYANEVARTLSTKRLYISTKNCLQSFEKEKNRVISFNSISLEWYYDFVSWMNGKGLKPNSQGSYIRIIKSALEEALDRGLHNNLSYKHKKFKVMAYAADTIYLDENEILALYKLDLSHKSRWEFIRDLFLVTCFTAFRISDAKRVTDLNVYTNNGLELVEIRTKKTNQKVTIPCHWILKNLLQKYNGKFPPIPEETTYNRTIKKICKLAKINSKVFITSKKGETTATEVFEKWEKVTSHTGRRSFATNATLAGIPKQMVMKLTGHQTELAFNKYVRIDSLQAAISIADHPFWRNTESHLRKA